ncbi:SGNH/GDSL hydrolase family protein [Mucilaginibacter myungsuensis]|uniref:SGNH hydrolase-type esterase domain-containing protein n=1 Tax=Mucilaginibacter myungsuensis TaxID=649104 RepID=A0A929L047_9SPHI|nr:SGNH/GDSL hydrolase family protein [Mucilaginibacter myungsuensis]MBE9663775.1 hypothetical protein [Mucilaginibacter myungsuensis]MDN3598900.1 SGNH/GDSL hydrolase family protein [Mucilaginibacter myungsuensis]
MRLWLGLILLLGVVGCRKDKLQPPSVLDDSYVKTHDVKVTSMGFNGSTSQDLHYKVDSVTKAKPDLIVLMVGVNDVIAARQGSYRDNLGTLIDLLRAGNDTEIMVLSPPTSVLNGYDGFSLDIIALRTDIQIVCAKKKCLYVDVNTVFREQESAALPLFNADRVHPNAAGYKLLAKTVLQSYAGNKLSKSNIVCFGDSLTYGAGVRGAGTITGDTYPAQFYLLLNNL